MVEGGRGELRGKNQRSSVSARWNASVRARPESSSTRPLRRRSFPARWLLWNFCGTRVHDVFLRDRDRSFGVMQCTLGGLFAHNSRAVSERSLFPTISAGRGRGRSEFKQIYVFVVVNARDRKYENSRKRRLRVGRGEKVRNLFPPNETTI